MQEVQKHLPSELNGIRGHCVQSPVNLCPSAQNDTAARSCSRSSSDYPARKRWEEPYCAAHETDGRIAAQLLC